jgi:ATP-dependent DNA helicase RecQ
MFLAKKLNIQESELIKQLQFLEENGIIDINWKTDLPKVTFLHERLPDDYMRLSEEVYHQRKERAYQRWNHMVTYLTQKHCREQFILTYFGQTATPCGKCDYCKDLKKEKLSKEALQQQILHALNITPKGLTLLIQQIGVAYSEEVKTALQGLMLEEKITFSDGLYFLN